MEEVSNMLPKIKSSIRNKLDYKSTTQTNLKNHSRLKDKTENHNLKNQFKIKLSKVIEIKIYLKQNFSKADVNDNFLQDCPSS